MRPVISFPLRSAEKQAQKWVLQDHQNCDRHRKAVFKESKSIFIFRHMYVNALKIVKVRQLGAEMFHWPLA